MFDREILKSLHPKIRDWVRQYEVDRKTAIHRENTLTGDPLLDALSLGHGPYVDLTKRDIYRFQLTSEFLNAVVREGWKVIKAGMGGGLLLNIQGEEIKFTIQEKMRRAGHMSKSDRQAWTAYPDFHNAALTTTGFLRFKVDTYCRERGQPEWVERDDAMAGELIPTILKELSECAQARRKWEIESQAKEAARELKRLEHEKVREQKKREEERWQKFRTLAADWKEAKLLNEFLDAVREHPERHKIATEGQPITDWIEWAQGRIEEINPLPPDRRPKW